MQQSGLDKNKSHLIRLTDIQKKKARRRLFGSIFLLLIALIILLNVTSRVVPIAVDPEKVTIEIKNTASNVKPLNSSQPAVIKAESQNVVNSAASAPVKKNASAGVNQVNNTNAQSESSIAETLALKPRLVIDTGKPAKPSPEDILNGNIPDTPKSKYYVQLIAGPDKDKLIKLQNSLANKGIKTLIQSVDTPNGTVYRLRVGPFSDRDDANSMLDTVNGVNNNDSSDNQ